ncbi:MFS transporter [Curtobacterium sp. MCBD17_034]|uniref:MFS transporter n=1 Tax=unclassified Curtobacterium TaxID=257496 RepID=UPI000DAA714F|nr:MULTISPECIES: MFS transporter [unclassified Curtobacterium]PZF58591.1 MFS transporter [Curtobacterium sp. MCBD17_034]PZM34581.1 MFS transporter [Curtobacterium sp. MCBD17_031]
MTIPPGRAARPGRAGILGRGYVLPTVGMVAIVAVSAFQNLAMATIMPVISRDLDGEALYSLAFAAPLAAGVPGMVVAGTWADRSGARVVTIVSALLFALGTAIVALAGSMPVFLGGRLVEGFGAGALTVVLYVIVSRIYPEHLHGRIFAGFAGAWVVPGLVGPAAAGVVTDTWGWHWVFVGALVIAVGSFVLLLPSLRRLPVPDVADRPAWPGPRIAWSAVAAVAVLGLNTAPDLAGALGPLVLAVGLVVAVVGLRPLLPVGTFRVAPGLPAVVVMRAVAGAAYMGSEVYLPYLLQAHHGFSPSAAGVTLTLAAISWAAASWAHGRIPERVLTARRAFSIGLTLVALGLLAAFVVAVTGVLPVVMIAGWFVAGAGMGIVYPRTSMLTLRLSDRADQGSASSALAIGDATGAVVGLAITGVAFTAFGGRAATVSFAVVFGAMTLVALAGLALVRRVGPVPAPRG